MKIDRSYITSEDNSKITWAKNGAAAYAVVNKDQLNKFGEAPGYRIFPSVCQHAHTLSNIADSIYRQR
jgi:primary-amine oxidase